ncbi:zinc finger protein 33A-like [Leguminivora glycinivorella]|uniref:zinc finger protein 33A-like n=1 Tax=Leguminivora glycinivorella TaxID=1035111 RepID=UPI00200EB6ED|nr:zinc finger protein 33A-like [Leguminivora glycinivorella]
MVQELYLCWECIAILKKVRMLKKKVEEAQRILQFYYTNKQDTFPDALSNLTTHTTDHQICLTYQEKEIKPVKEEIDIYDEFDHFDNENIKDEPDNETNITVVDKVQTTLVTTPVITAVTTLVTTPVITAVTTPVTTPVTLETNDWMEFNLKRIKNRKAKYRFLNVKLRKHRKLLVRKIPIEFDAVLNGLEEERRSNTFLIMKYKCVSCVAAWSDEEGLAKHYKKCHDESIGPYQCGICKTRLLDNLGAHQTKHYQRECKVCRLRSCSQFAMDRHLEQHDRMVQCLACGLCFKERKVCRLQSWSQFAMDRHLEQHDRMVQCLACGLCFKNVRLFYNHYKELHASFVCDVCGKRCKSRAIIEKHLRYHFGYECPHCKRKLKNSTSYKNHLETHTSSVSDGSYCVQCDRRFSSDRMYRRHLQSSAAHAAERDNTRVKRKYPCPECANVYSRRTYMNNHYRHVHAKQSRYHCADCDRHFLNRTRYLDHRRFQHEGLKRDKDKLCNICGRGFAANRTLVNHIRTHSGERPFACEFCGAKFTQKHAMLSHVKYIHLKSKRKTNYE